jgi:CDP-paratose 2-epimerase
MKILVTGSSGLIGGEVVEYFGNQGHTIVGIDNNMRREFFGEAGDTLWNLHRVVHSVPNYKHHQSDIRDRHTIDWIFRDLDGPFDVVIHCAAQPSHDKSREIPVTDFDVNAVGTLNLLEATRKYAPQAVFIFMSTNKVYGDAPNEKLLIELPNRFDFAKDEDKRGIDETCRIDQSTHSIFGASKVAADILVQEYGRYFGLKTAVLRGGCLTGPGHSGVELHGFLSYLVKCAIESKTYKIYGYKGKQVRDNIHSYDVVRAMDEIIKNPKCGAVYNMGGGRENSISILEAIDKIESLIGKKINYEYVDTPRVGDHVCYISDLAKFKSDFPHWQITKGIDQTLSEMIHTLYWGKYSDHEDTKVYPDADNAVIWDVGGFRGSWTASILEHYSPSKVYIFEPIKEFYDDCQRRFKTDPRVHIINAGLSNRNGTASLSKDTIHSSEFKSSTAVENVPLRDIAELCFEEEIAVISINAEGAEFEILRRLIDTGNISKFKNVQVQFHNFHPNAENLRSQIRADLAKTHIESFNYPFVWESWKRK